MLLLLYLLYYISCAQFSLGTAYPFDLRVCPSFKTNKIICLNIIWLFDRSLLIHFNVIINSTVNIKNIQIFKLYPSFTFLAHDRNEMDRIDVCMNWLCKYLESESDSCLFLYLYSECCWIIITTKTKTDKTTDTTTRSDLQRLSTGSVRL